jgi:hypothetical protein
MFEYYMAVLSQRAAELGHGWLITIQNRRARYVRAHSPTFFRPRA